MVERQASDRNVADRGLIHELGMLCYLFGKATLRLFPIRA